MSRFFLPVMMALLTVPAHGQDLVANRTKGSAKAPVTVYEMSDFQCPYCRDFTVETFPTIEAEYIKTGKVKWVFVNFPIPQLHKNAVAAAEFAMCSARQQKFWPAHDRLYARQGEWARLADPAPWFLAQVKSLDLDQAALMTCLTGGTTRNAIRADAEGAAKSGAGSTPSFYIEGGMMVGNHPIADFRQVLDSIIALKQRRR